MTWENFWFVITVAVVAWYSIVTLYVAVKGGFDIRTMLRHLGSMNPPPDK